MSDANNVKLILMEDDRNADWDAFVATGINYCFYHDSAFNDYYRYKTAGTLKIAFEKDGDIIAALPGGIVGENKDTFAAPFSASFGGFCVGAAAKLEDIFHVVELLDDFLREKGVKRVILRQPPVMYSAAPDERLSYTLLRYGYHHAVNDLTLYVTAEDTAASTFTRNVKKAAREGLSFRECADPGPVWDFIAAHKKKRSIPFSVSHEETVGLKTMLKDRIRFFGVFLGETLVAAIIVYYLNEVAALGFNWEQDYHYQALRPTDYMLYFTAEAVFHSGRRYFDLGNATGNGEPNWGVARYKEKLSPRGALRTSWEKTLV